MRIRYYVCATCAHQTRGTRFPRRLFCRNCNNHSAHWQISTGADAAIAAARISTAKES